MQKTKILNKIREFLFFSLIAEKILITIIRMRIFYCIFSKMPINYYQYKKSTIRKVKRHSLWFELDLSHYMEWALYYYIDIEPREWIYSYNFNHGLCIDVGAHFGEISLQLAQHNPQSIILSFEPNLLMFNKLQKNIQLNNIQNVYAFQMAVGDSLSDVFLHVDLNHPEGAHLINSDPKYSTIKTQQVALDELIKNHKFLLPVTLIKIDTEGYELFVLKGASEILKKYKPLLIMEYNIHFMHRYNYHLKDIIDFLKSFGYQNFIVLHNQQNLTTQSITGQSVPQNGDLIIS